MPFTRPAAVGILALIAFIVTVAACSGDDDAGDEPPATDTEPSDDGEDEDAQPELVEPPRTLEIDAGSVEGPIHIRAFLPSEVTIRVGDTLHWAGVPGEHTVSFLAEGEGFPLIIPDPASPADVVFNPRVVAPEPNPLTGAFDGSAPFNSGLFDEAGTSLTFSTPGSYQYRCLVHPQMTGGVDVLDDPAADATDQQQADEDAASELSDYLEEAEDALANLSDEEPESAEGPNGTTSWEVTAGISTPHADIRVFVPDQLEIEEGDTVVWVNRAREPHTVTFGEAIPLQVEDTRGDGMTRLVLNPDVLNVTLGGFEFVEGELFHSGLLLENGPLGVRFQLLFATEGAFTYINSLYPDEMSGAIVVR